jgi:uncharacterized protein (TIGR02646 family)
VIHVDRPDTPAVLKDDSAKAKTERDKVEKHFTTPATRTKSCKAWKIYKDPEVVAELHNAFGGKCAYCESRYAHTAPMDVEHFRPKGGVAIDGQKKLKVPGYWWLASDWANLLPSCIDCNRERTQEFPNEDPDKAGKANKFPLKPGTAHAEEPGKEKTEKALLIDPCREQPEKYLVFDEKGLALPKRKHERGQAAIKVHGLNRQGLVSERAAMATNLLTAIKRLREAVGNAQRHPNDPHFATQLKDRQAEVLAFKNADNEYAQLARQLLDRFEKGLL